MNDNLLEEVIIIFLRATFNEDAVVTFVIFIVI